MGKQKKSWVRGTFGNVIYYESRGQHLVRIVPAKINQSPESMEQAHLFGRSNRCSTIVRTLLSPISPVKDKRPLMKRMNIAFRNWYVGHSDELKIKDQNIPAFYRLTLNEATYLPAIFVNELKVSREHGDQLQLLIPSMDPTQSIKAPPNTTEVACNIMLVALPIAAPTTATAVQLQHIIPYSPGEQPASTYSSPIQPKPGTLILVGLALQFISEDDEPNELLRWQPAGMVGSLYN